MSRPRVAIVSVVPSPYQRDLFQALNARPELDLEVFYQEKRPHDSPWPECELAGYEKLLPGFYFRMGTVRSHWNWALPDPADFDLWILNASLTSVTMQWLMRWGLRKRRWLFWGERLREQLGRVRAGVQNFLAAPLERSSGIISIGSLAREDYARRFPRVRQEAVPYCTRLEDFFKLDRRAAGSGDDVTFLFCGQMISRKGVDLLLQAFDRLVTEGAAVRLILVGREGELPSWLEGLSAATRARVRYEGFQPPEQLPRYFAQADVFILPSRHDGWGVVVNQAMGAGLAVLATDQVGAACDWVENGVNGLLFSAGDGEAVYEAMRTGVDQRGQLAQWGSESRRRAANLVPEAGAQRLVEIVQTVLQSAAV